MLFVYSVQYPTSYVFQSSFATYPGSYLTFQTAIGNEMVQTILTEHTKRTLPQSASPPMTWTNNNRQISYYESRPVGTNSKQEMILHVISYCLCLFVFPHEMRMLLESGQCRVITHIWCCNHDCINIMLLKSHTNCIS